MVRVPRPINNPIAVPGLTVRHERCFLYFGKSGFLKHRDDDVSRLIKTVVVEPTVILEDAADVIERLILIEFIFYIVNQCIEPFYNVVYLLFVRS